MVARQYRYSRALVLHNWGEDSKAPLSVRLTERMYRNEEEARKDLGSDFIRLSNRDEHFEFITVDENGALS